MVDGSLMNLEPWISFQEALRAEHKGPFYASKRDFELFAAFVEQQPASERIPMLLHAYDRYRSLSVGGGPRKPINLNLPVGASSSAQFLVVASSLIRLRLLKFFGSRITDAGTVLTLNHL